MRPKGFLNMSDVRTVKIKFSDLVFLEDNPRTIKKENLSRLAERIKQDPTFFDNRPALVNFTEGRYVCYAGFQRSHAAAKILKWKEVPCSVENDVPTETMRKRAILDNTHDGDWDADILANWEFDVEELGDMGVPSWVFGGDGEEIEEVEIDKSKFNQSADSYLNNSIRQVVLYYDVETHERVLERLQSVGTAYEIEDDNSAVVLKLLEFYESRK